MSERRLEYPKKLEKTRKNHKLNFDEKNINSILIKKDLNITKYLINKLGKMLKDY